MASNANFTNNVDNEPMDQDIAFKNDQQSLESYQDVSGVTVKSLNFGLWWVQNVKFFKRIMFWLLVAIGAISWFYTLGNFIYYIAFGMHQDDLLLQKITNSRVNFASMQASAPKDLVVQDLQTIDQGDGKYDFIVKVLNPNPEHYATFSFNFENSSTSTQPQQGFMLPGEEKYLVSLGNVLDNSGYDMRIKINNLSWQRLDRHKIANWSQFHDERLNFRITEPRFVAANLSGLSEKESLSQIEFSVANVSSYNYYDLPLYVFIYSFDSIIGVTQTSLSHLRSRDERQVSLNYGGKLGRVDRIVVVPNVDILRDDVYYKFQGEAGQ